MIISVIMHHYLGGRNFLTDAAQPGTAALIISIVSTTSNHPLYIILASSAMSEPVQFLPSASS